MKWYVNCEDEPTSSDDWEDVDDYNYDYDDDGDKC